MTGGDTLKGLRTAYGASDIRQTRHGNVELMAARTTNKRSAIGKRRKYANLKALSALKVRRQSNLVSDWARNHLLANNVALALSHRSILQPRCARCAQ